MGYTHFWFAPEAIRPRIWWVVMADALKLVEAFPGPGGLCMGIENQAQRAFVSREEIRFNGGPGAQAEDFRLTREAGKRYSSCKTQHQPYERLVCAILASTADRTRLIRVTSDGNHHDWLPYIEWASTVLRRPLPMPIHTNEITG